MYPLPRMLIAAALSVAIAYAILAMAFAVPALEGYIGELVGLPVLVGIAVAIFGRGEPNDQIAVHGPRMSEAEFNALEDRVERPAIVDPAADAPDRPARRSTVQRIDREEDDFTDLVRQAIEELPPEFASALDHVAVVVSNQGAVQRINGRLQPLYGLYIGYGGRSSYIIGRAARNALPDRIVIFRDTLEHDYGQDPQHLRTEVTRTLRHELGHHLGFDEQRARALGL